MDALTTILFYLFAALAVVGALAAAVSPRSPGRAALLAVAIGTAGCLAVLSAGFAALVALVAIGGCALLLPRPEPVRPGGRAEQLAGVAAAVLFAVLAYAAWTSAAFAGHYPGGWFNSAAVARWLLGRDALALFAVGALAVPALLAGGRAWRGRRR